MKILALLATFAFAIAGAAERPVAFPKKLDKPGFLAGIWDVGACYVSGQPTAEAYRELAKDGVKTVINLRGQKEMDDRSDVPFDEAALLKELGIEYVHIPLGASEDYKPAAVAQFANALGKAEGKVLLHCTVAWRASYMWTAYLYTNRHYTLDDAIQAGAAMNTTADRFGPLLGTQITYSASPKKAGARTPHVSGPANPSVPIEPPSAVHPPNKDNYMAFTMWSLGKVYNSSQPDADNLREIAGLGVKTVVNIRSDKEMENVNKDGFNEKSVAESLGMKYVSVPMASLEAFTPANLALIADAIEKSPGKVLLHCNTATRTSSIWVAYLVKYRGVTLDEAVKHGEAMRYSNLLTDLLGIDITYKVRPTVRLGCGG